MISECTQVMMRYATAQDQGRADLFADLFTEEAVWERSDGDMIGRATILAHLEKVTDARTGPIRHLITTLDIEPLGDREVQATAYVLVYRSIDDRGPQMTAVFDYTTRLVEQDGSWRIARHRSKPMK